jgi:hypothetical protein
MFTKLQKKFVFVSCELNVVELRFWGYNVGSFVLYAHPAIFNGAGT